MRSVFTLLTASLALCCSLAVAQAEKRVALVIGNGKYQRVGTLRNPEHDANAMADLFRRTGFDRVDIRTNLDQAQLRKALRDFSDVVADSDVAVVFYSGHGIEVGGSNYLIPVDAALRRDIDVEDETVSLERVSQIVEPARRLRLIIVDACRENPFAPGMRRSSTRPIGHGFAAVEVQTRETMIAFAAKPGATASDGTGNNSPYTTALLHNLLTPGLDIRLSMGRVRDEVLAATRHQQEPTTFNSLGGREFALLPGSTAPPPPKMSEPDAAERAWALSKDTTSIAILEEFLRQHGASIYANYARARIAELRKTQAAAVTAPPSVTPPITPPCQSTKLTSSSAARAPCPLSAAEERGLKPKDVFRECPHCPEMVVVPPGSFTMGSPATETGRFTDEGPQHPVSIRQPFAVGKFHVTVDQFAAFVRETGYDSGSSCWGWIGGDFREQNGFSWKSPGFAQAGTHPAVCLNWNDAHAYVAWMARQTGRAYRLLSESEFEYATRAGSSTAYFFGNKEAELCRYANGADKTEQSKVPGVVRGTGLPCSDGYAYTSPSGSFAPNGFRLYDMHGNVNSWAEDCYHDSYTGAPTDESAWTSGDCTRRVVRGGPWNGSARLLRSAFRFKYTTEIRNRYLGFRVARTLAPAP
ncbi:MAG: SUMF1/EgtB/PvdO family nonheme iron enzyme [Alphaproteobacteria bacterium]|nr:SUMF1/EgtB/PvdO family nonheme iron enzyme [Alphaproteobacteria bacterium]